MSTLAEVVEGLAAALEPVRAGLPDLQIYPYWLANPTPPTIDIYPGDPFQDGAGFGGGKACFFTVRARVSTADQDAGQQGLLQMLDPEAATSVEGALTADQTLGGLVDSVAVVPEGTSGYREYLADTAVNGRLLGVEWRLEVLT